MYRTITYRAILHDTEINGKMYNCVHKIICELTPASELEKVLENEKIKTGNPNLYLGFSHWEEWV